MTRKEFIKIMDIVFKNFNIVKGCYNVGNYSHSNHNLYCCYAIKHAGEQVLKDRFTWQVVYLYKIIIQGKDGDYGMFGDPNITGNQEDRFNSLVLFEQFVLDEKLYRGV
jgi:hypothetical protein